MGFLDNAAMRSANKRLRPFMRSDERLIEYDVCDITPPADVRVDMLNVAVVLSDRAIYVLSKPDSVRFPYQEVMQVEGDSRMFGWASSLGGTYLVTVRGRPKGNLCETIAHLVEKQVAHHEEMRVGDEVVVAECRPRREDGPLVWTMYHTGGLDFNDPQVQRTIRSRLAPLSDKLGVAAPYPDAT